MYRPRGSTAGGTPAPQHQEKETAAGEREAPSGRIQAGKKAVCRSRLYPIAVRRSVYLVAARGKCGVRLTRFLGSSASLQMSCFGSIVRGGQPRPSLNAYKAQAVPKRGRSGKTSLCGGGSPLLRHSEWLGVVNEHLRAAASARCKNFFVVEKALKDCQGANEWQQEQYVIDVTLLQGMIYGMLGCVSRGEITAAGPMTCDRRWIARVVWQKLQPAS
jgi:hypothetical protein